MIDKELNKIIEVTNEAIKDIPIEVITEMSMFKMNQDIMDYEKWLNETHGGI